MAVETVGTCEKHQLPLDLQGECQLCRLSGMPSQTPPSRAGKWATMVLLGLMAGAITWAVASFEPSEAPIPTRGVSNSAPQVAAPAAEEPAPEKAVVPIAPLPTDENATVDGPETTLEPTDKADGQAQEWALARAQVQIHMYATTSCDVCREARDYMGANGIAFTEHDIEEDKGADRRIRELNPERITPTFEVDDLVFVGFSPDEFEATRTQAAGKYLSKGAD